MPLSYNRDDKTIHILHHKGEASFKFQTKSDAVIAETIIQFIEITKEADG